MSNSIDDIDYFTVVGVGRSGTSLLMTMLDSHPLLSLPPETQFVTRHVVRHPNAAYEDARRLLSSENNFSRLGISLEDFFSCFVSCPECYSNAAAYRRIIQLWSNKTGLTRIGDKSPKNIECLPVIQRLFPNARVIHIIRDPRDVFLSRTKAEWCSNRNRWLQTLAYRAQFDEGRRQGRRLYGKNYLEIRYEDLIRDPEESLEAICNLLQVRFDAQMLDRDESASTHVFSEELDWKREVLGPLLAGNTDKWRRELTPEAVGFIEDCCTTAFGGFGYEPAMNSRLGQGGFKGQMTRRTMNALSSIYTGRLTRMNNRAIRAITEAPRHKVAA